MIMLSLGALFYLAIGLFVVVCFLGEIYLQDKADEEAGLEPVDPDLVTMIGMSLLIVALWPLMSIYFLTTWTPWNGWGDHGEDS